jgi:hypothetical protein
MFTQYVIAITQPVPQITETNRFQWLLQQLRPRLGMDPQLALLVLPCTRSAAMFRCVLRECGIVVRAKLPLKLTRSTTVVTTMNEIQGIDLHAIELAFEIGRSGHRGDAHVTLVDQGLRIKLLQCRFSNTIETGQAFRLEIQRLQQIQ